ncbi:MAG: alpha/beta hydrolase [Proteobacteria bacterium]|nr:alpha/beta hydrolase [Pseudomonadota bacterium]
MTRVQKQSGKTAQKAVSPEIPAFRIDRGSAAAGTRLILAHGAGAGISSPFLEAMAERLEERDLSLTLFEFAYMAGRRTGGPKRPPPRAEALVDEYRACVDAIRTDYPRANLVIGGKSLGGRVASLIADELYEKKTIAGLVCLGYPFHPPGKPDQLRTEHLKDLRCPALIVQGERDPFGSHAEVSEYRLSRKIKLSWMNDGDHDFGPRGASGFTRKGNLAAAADAVAAFVARISEAR